MVVKALILFNSLYFIKYPTTTLITKLIPFTHNEYIIYVKRRRAGKFGIKSSQPLQIHQKNITLTLLLVRFSFISCFCGHRCFINTKHSVVGHYCFQNIQITPSLLRKSVTLSLNDYCQVHTMCCSLKMTFQTSE